MYSVIIKHDESLAEEVAKEELAHTTWCDITLVQFYVAARGITPEDGQSKRSAVKEDLIEVEGLDRVEVNELSTSDFVETMLEVLIDYYVDLYSSDKALCFERHKFLFGEQEVLVGDRSYPVTYDEDY